MADSVSLYIQNVCNNSNLSTETPIVEANFERVFKDAQVSIIVLYTVLCVVAVIGNSSTVYVVVCRRSMRNVTNYFVASLAVSDFLMAVICIPFSFVANVLFNYWPFGEVLCPVVTYIQVAVVFQNAYTMLAMSLERYIAITYPFLRRLRKRRCLQLVALCWALAFLTPIPTAVTSQLHSNINNHNETFYTCLEKWSTERQRFSYSLTIMVLQYFVPLAVLIYTYAKIVHIIWLKDVPAPAELLHHNKNTDTPKEKDIDPRKKVIKMMISVVGIYGFCWLPLHFITIAGDVDSSIFRKPYMRVVWVTSHWLAMSSCAYNPFIYWWMNSKFREGYLSMLHSFKSVLCWVCKSENKRKTSTISTGNRKYFFRVRDNSGNATIDQRLSATQMVGCEGTFTEGNRKCDTVLLVDHHGNDNAFSKEVSFITEIGNRPEVSEYVTSGYVSRDPCSKAGKHDDTLT